MSLQRASARPLPKNESNFLGHSEKQWDGFGDPLMHDFLLAGLDLCEVLVFFTVGVCGSMTVDDLVLMALALTDFDSDPPWFMLNSGQLMMKLAHWRQLPWLLCQKLSFKLRSCICHAFLETLVCYLIVIFW